jgi:hypothetical protein
MVTENPWEEALREAYNAAPLSAVVLPTIELRHASFIDNDNQPFAIRFVRDYGTLIEEGVDGAPAIYGWYLKLEPDAPMQANQTVMFQSCMFDFRLPEQLESKTTGIELSFDNVTALVSSYLDRAIQYKSTMALIYREYLADTPNVVQLKMDNLSIKSISANIFKVTASASYIDLINKKFPNKLYRVDEYPGLLT